MESLDKSKLIEEIKEIIDKKIDFSKDFTDEEVEEIIREAVFEKSKEYYLSIGEKKEIINIIFNNMRRLDILQPILDDNEVTEIMINGPNDVFIEKNGRVYKSEKKFQSREKLEDVIQSIVSKVNRTVNESSPIVDARLKDGSRVNVVLSPIALNGPIVTIRKFPDKPFFMEELISNHSVSEEGAEALSRMVKARYNIFISGGTSSGKTTFLNVLSNFIPKDERIITIEDSAELRITNVKNLVSLETRDANTENKGEVTIRDLIKTSLRMRPDRIVVGEVRGKEALDMLQAMNTGHDGSLSTGHANSTNDMLSRLETMVLSGSSIPLAAIRQQIASAIDIIVHLAKLRDKSRKIIEISEVLGYENGEIRLNPLFVFDEDKELSTANKVIGSLKRTKNEMRNKLKFNTAGIPDKL
ncbi:CpaF family protein [Sporosalibacterium faouarense]|uniref:CpaF family protein n=1 Tax=Sporosalibacterium faouarense TaxID=516123 RepID=UPI00192A90D9|nr:CpaF family protein [Sporosalibacterium faouarense]